MAAAQCDQLQGSLHRRRQSGGARDLLGRRRSGFAPSRVATSFRLVDNVPEHTLWVNKVPEPRTVKQRVHLDVDVSAVSDLTDLGAVIIDDTQSWTVLADPEGGEAVCLRP